MPGIGPRTASALIRRFDDISNLLDHLADITPAKVRESLASSSQQVRLNEELARLRSDFPLGQGPLIAALAPHALTRLGKLFEDLEFKSLQPRLDAVAALLARSASEDADV